MSPIQAILLTVLLGVILGGVLSAWMRAVLKPPYYAAKTVAVFARGAWLGMVALALLIALLLHFSHLPRH